MTRSILVLLLAVLHLSQSFTLQGPAFVGVRTASRNTHLFAGQSDKEGGAAIAKPKIGQKTAVEVQTKQKVQILRKAKPAEPVQRREEEFQEAPLFKLMLVGDDSYDVTHVVERICAIVDDMDEDRAANVFQQANQEGKAMCGKYPFERAELFKEQLQRSDPMIFAGKCRQRRAM
jgi:ATP-dependent Clp protease adapter protein ClpS